MSKEDDARKRQESNTRNRDAANRQQRIADEKQAAYDKNQAKLERLRQARSTLKKHLTTLGEFENETKNYATKLSADQFKGTLRDKFDEKAKKMGTSMHTEENSHQENLALLDAAIAQKELEQGDLLGAIGSALDSVKNFLASIF